MNRIEYEEAFLREGLEQLKAYLLSDQLFWNLGLANPSGFSPYPQFTLGNLLLSAQIVSLDSGEGASDLRYTLDREKSEWLGAWNKKAEKESLYRLKEWGRYLSEMESERSAHQKGHMAMIVRSRAVLELLRGQSGKSSTIDSVDSFDAVFRGLTQPGEFIWDDDIQKAFSEEAFWFLFREQAP